MLAGVNSQNFDAEESGNALTTADSQRLVFDGVQNDFITPNGNGPRDEFKTPEEVRVDTDSTNETFSSRVSSDISDGGRTIIAQYHDEASGLPFALYLSDGQSRANGIANDEPDDGVFDLYSVHRGEDGENNYNVYGTVEAGEAFDVQLNKQGTDLQVEVNNVQRSLDLRDGEGLFFKFGSYTQAEDPNATSDEAGQLTESGSEESADALREIGITSSRVTFDDLEYSRSTI